MQRNVIFALVAALALATAVKGGEFDDDETDDFSEAPGTYAKQFGPTRNKQNPDVISRERETALMIGHEKLFKDFCLSQRDYLISDMKNNARQSAASLFTQLFTSFNDIADDLLNVERDAVEQLARQIENPSAPISEDPMPENQIQALIEEGKREISRKAAKTYGGLLPGGRTALMALLSTVNSAFFIKLAQARSYVSASTLRKTIEANCDRVAKYEETLSENIEQAKQEIAQSNQDKPEVQEFLKTVSINSLHCLSTKNIARMSAACSLFKIGRAPFLKMLGINSA